MKKISEKNMTNPIKYFNFYYLVLGAKHWYARAENESLYDFVIRLIRLENRFCVCKTANPKASAVYYCFMCLDELAKWYRSNGVQKGWDNYCTMFGEIEKYKLLYRVDDYEEAVILFTFNVLMQLDGEEITLPKPIYRKGYPRLYKLIEKPGMTYKEMRKMADKVFDNIYM